MKKYSSWFFSISVLPLALLVLYIWGQSSSPKPDNWSQLLLIENAVLISIVIIQFANLALLIKAAPKKQYSVIIPGALSFIIAAAFIGLNIFLKVIIK